jgi:hypothetical protein
MAQTTTGNSGGGTFCIDNEVREIGLTQRGIIIATNEGRVFGWVYDYIKPHEGIRYTVRYVGTKDDLFSLVTKPRTALVFIEAGFFGEKTIGCLKRIRKENSKLRAVLFSVSAQHRVTQIVISGGVPTALYPYGKTLNVSGSK